MYLGVACQISADAYTASIGVQQPLVIDVTQPAFGPPQQEYRYTPIPSTGLRRPQIKLGLGGLVGFSVGAGGIQVDNF